MPDKVDPRKHARPLADVPALVAEGARLFNEARYWHAHEAWEEGWHALRAAERPRTAAFLQGLILATAALENLRRGKADGFRRQLAQGLHHLRGNAGEGAALGVAGEDALVEALLALHLDASRRTRLAGLDELGVNPPRIEIDG